MKNRIYHKRHKAVFCLLFPCLTFSFIGCKEEIDESNFAIKQEQTIADYIDANKNYSSILKLYHEVNLGSVNGSSLYGVLTARGNYTVFLPNNAAIDKYLNENGIPCIDSLTFEQKELIAKSSIIDNGSDNAYETAELPTRGALKLPNLNDRILSCEFDQSDAHYIINGDSKIIEEDIDVSNGKIHIIETVIAPSSLTLDKQIAEAANMKVFSHLLQATSWCDSLYANLDKTYEDPNRLPRKHMGEFTYQHAEHRYIGYTALVEPDSIYERELGLKVECDEEGNLTNGQAFIQQLLQRLGTIYGQENLDDLTHPDNPINRYVAYHLLYGKMPYNRLVYHYNEYNYQYGNWAQPQMNNVPTNVWEFYTTMGQHPSLVKITQVGDAGFEHDTEHRIYANRISNYANGLEDDYHEVSVESGLEGILIESTNGEYDNNALNGYYLPINNLLIYSPKFREELYKRRIRFDISSTFHEFATNNLRGNFKTCFEKGYLDRIVHQTENTSMGISHAQGSAWLALWGDEFRIFGLYDFTYQLPPVPKDGTYEIRMGCSHGPIRGMAQIYFGDDPDRLTPAGLPYDMRIDPGEKTPEIPWFPDTEDWTMNRERDKNLKNQGYLKGPQYYTRCLGNASEPVRSHSGWKVLRRVLTTAYLKADKTYYLRFKSALKKTDAELNIDFFEYASPHVYNGPEIEDIW